MDENLIGLKLVNIRRLTPEEVEAEGWDRGTTALEFEDGTLIYASRDEEGNGPGQLFGRKGEESFYVFASA